jgi:hypothetical protein
LNRGHHDFQRPPRAGMNRPGCSVFPSRGATELPVVSCRLPGVWATSDGFVAQTRGSAGRPTLRFSIGLDASIERARTYGLCRSNSSGGGFSMSQHLPVGMSLPRRPGPTWRRRQAAQDDVPSATGTDGPPTERHDHGDDRPCAPGSHARYGGPEPSRKPPGVLIRKGAPIISSRIGPLKPLELARSIASGCLPSSRVFGCRIHPSP